VFRLNRDLGARHSTWIGWSSFFLAAQSVCSVFVALSSLRLVLGAVAFSSAVGVMEIADRSIHIDLVRVPMVALSLGGALFNLLALWQVRRLRGRAASAWRQKKISKGKVGSEWFQLALSLATLVMLTVESCFHFRYAHHL
jgi:hypothetical protein